MHTTLRGHLWLIVHQPPVSSDDCAAVVKTQIRTRKKARMRTRTLYHHLVSCGLSELTVGYCFRSYILFMNIFLI
jgi:hypothetical protein